MNETEPTDAYESDTEQSVNKSVAGVVVGAWGEAIGAKGVKRPILVGIVAILTIPFFPAWLLLMGLEIFGLYDVEEGFGFFDAGSERGGCDV